MIIRIAAGTGIMAAMLAGATVPYPVDYREWTHVKTMFVGPQNKSFEQRGGFHHYYANSKAIEGYRTRKFPDGSVIVDEGVYTRDENGVILEGSRRSLDVMRKDGERYRDTGGWGFEHFEGDNRIEGASAEVRVACFSCHSKNRDRDFVFSEVRAGDWSPRLAADYLDGRQKEWFAWAPAKAAGGSGGPCVSCHTNVTYLLARPALRRTLGEKEPTVYETGLQDALRARLDRTLEEVVKVIKEPVASQQIGVEAVLSSLFLTSGSFQQRALDRLWSLQIQTGKAKGSWAWFDFNTAPYEVPGSEFFGSSLAAMAVGSTSSEYRAREDVKRRIAELAAYFERERGAQPLHNRLMLLWASTRLPEILSAPARQSIIDEALTKQRPDGSWTTTDLGPWTEHPNAPSPTEDDSYATAVATFTLEQGGVPLSDPRMTRALAWLRSHQDRKGGYWPAVSMNKRFEAGSMQSQFMQDAATAFAAMALVGAEKTGGR